MKKKLKKFFNGYQSIIISVSATLALCMTVGSLILVVAAWPTEVRQKINSVEEKCSNLERRTGGIIKKHEEDLETVVRNEQFENKLKAELSPIQADIKFLVKSQDLMQKSLDKILDKLP